MCSACRAQRSRCCPAERFRLGATTAISGKPLSVASNQQVSLKSAQGELPRLPALGVPFAMVELQLTGLTDESATDEKGQQFDCPNCGAPVLVTLATSKSITCRACNSLIDLSQGVGGALAHAMQHEPVTPLITLGSAGLRQGTTWQVVGFQHRPGRERGKDERRRVWLERLPALQRQVRVGVSGRCTEREGVGGVGTERAILTSLKQGPRTVPRPRPIRYALGTTV